MRGSPKLPPGVAGPLVRRLEELRTVVDRASLLAHLVDAERRVIWCSTGVTDLLGVDYDALVPGPIDALIDLAATKVVHPKWRAEFRKDQRIRALLAMEHELLGNTWTVLSLPVRNRFHPGGGTYFAHIHPTRLLASGRNRLLGTLVVITMFAVADLQAQLGGYVARITPPVGRPS